jgi:hypothetical protein
MGLLGVARANTAVGVCPETFLLPLLQLPKQKDGVSQATPACVLWWKCVHEHAPTQPCIEGQLNRHISLGRVLGRGLVPELQMASAQGLMAPGAAVLPAAVSVRGRLTQACWLGTAPGVQAGVQVDVSAVNATQWYPGIKLQATQ